MRTEKPFLFPVAVTVLMVLLFASRAAGQEVILRNIIVNNDHGEVHLRFGLRTRDADKLAQYLKQGTNLRLVCTAAMDLERNLWWDRELRRSSKNSLLHYDSLNDEYRLHKGKNGSGERNSDLSSLLQSGWGQIDMYLGPWPDEYKEENLALHLSVRLIRADVPVWLKRTLFFWSWNVVPVRNYRIRFGS